MSQVSIVLFITKYGHKCKPTNERVFCVLSLFSKQELERKLVEGKLSNNLSVVVKIFTYSVII